jgi:FtsH-binding integral membrane protein
VSKENVERRGGSALSAMPVSKSVNRPSNRVTNHTAHPSTTNSCQDLSRVTGVDEWLAQTNTMWIAALSLLPFSFTVLFVPTTINGHIAYYVLWVAALLLVGFTSFLLSRAARRLSPLREGDREYRGWQGRDVALAIALVEAGAIVVGLSLLAWREGIDILTDDYKAAFRVSSIDLTCRGG